MRTMLRLQAPPDELGKPLVCVHLLAVYLPVLLLLDVAGAPLVVREEGVLEVVAELPLLDGGDYLADECVRISLCVSANGQQYMGWDEDNACK